MSNTATVTGRLLESDDQRIVLAIPKGDYQLHLVPVGEVKSDPMGQIRGIIRAQARRVDVIAGGGCYIEPIFGRPRRVQGRIIGGDVQDNSITVAAATPLIATLMPPQKTANFAIGQMVSFDIERGATFVPQVHGRSPEAAS